MSFQNKRGALNQLTKDEFEGGDEYSRDGPVEEARTADAATMSKRKVLPLPKRRGGSNSAASTPKAVSNGFSGSGFGSGASPASPMSFSASSGAFGASSSDDSSTSESTLKRIAMNDKFVETITSKVRENGAVDLSDVVSKYLEYSKGFGNVSVSVPSASASVPASSVPSVSSVAAPSTATPEKPKSQFSFGAAKNFSAEKSSPFGFKADKTEDKDTKTEDTKTDTKTEVKDTTTSSPKPFTFGSTSSGPAFSFGKTGADVAKDKTPSFSFSTKKEDKEEKKEEKKPVAVDSDSDSDDDAIDITKGPSFTLAAPPTTTNSAFSFKPQADKESTKSSGPSFTFDGKVSTGSFKFKEDAKEEKEEKKEDAKKDYTWNPSQGVVFGSNKTEKEESKPAFSFGAKPEAKDDKPMFGSSAVKPFTFGSSDKTEAKPFSFGSSEKTDKPAFSFGKPAESASSATSDKPAFSFGKTESATDKPAFAFGKPAEAAKPFSFGKSDSAAPAPAFGVSGNLFKNDKKEEAKPASADSGEPDDTPKTVTDSDDLSGQGPGEENEDNVAEYRVKLYKLDDGKWDVCGVGQLRVLVDKDTKKARLLMRAEQSGRVLLNCVVRKELTYSTTKSNVNIVDFDADSKPIKYMARIKTAPEAEQLSAKIEEVK
ncbi:Nucleoporin NSP1 [Yarrowia sp. C11]|nr:Nucleoporin NSP1 [Yarrowia sp. E02]KAG5373170.1 Nucleoporin NSP1 [Yarrowia sp. C11]